MIECMISQPAMNAKRKKPTANEKRPAARRSAAHGANGGAKIRSRSGCHTCKAKHIKCDETRPECCMCTRKGLQCGGYSRELKWSYKHEKDPMIYEFTSEFFVGTGSDKAGSGSDRNSPTSESHSNTTAAATAAAAAAPSSPPDPRMAQHADMSSGTDGGFDFASDTQFPASLNFGFENEQEEDLFFTMLNSCEPIQDVLNEQPPQPPPQLISSPASIANATAASFVSCTDSDMDMNTNTSRRRSTTVLDDGPIEMFTTNNPTPFLLPSSSTLSTLPDTTLQLITSWFDQVCPAWSAFDSQMNLNRKLASDLWHNSACVFNSLQFMSASFLSARLPQMRRPALSLMRTATLCIQAEVTSLKAQSRLRCMPTSLLFSLCCLGTTVCWLDASFLGIPFLREAKALIQRIDKQVGLVTGHEDRERLAFFKKSLTYWEMLLAVTGPEDLETDWDDETVLEESTQKQQQQQQQQQQSPPLIGPSRKASLDDQPHPWTGVSTKISYLFARSIKLCRTFRNRVTLGAETTSGYIQDIQAAQRLEEQLLELDFASIAEQSDTGDQKTPWLHLARVAEAYKLSSLLQLYQTFPDLVSLRLPMNAILSGDGQVPWEKWITPLNLKLIEILKHIPPDSGSRVIQPLLYICASTGLRYNLMDSSVLLMPQQQQQQQQQQQMPPSGRGQTNGRRPSTSVRGPFATASSSSSSSSAAAADLLAYVGQIDGTEAPDLGPVSVSRMALDICNARNFVMTRLNILEGSLQPKPIMVAKDLVKAIWASYDQEVPGCTAVHWLDVMESQDLRSLFG